MIPAWQFNPPAIVSSALTLFVYAWLYQRSRRDQARVPWPGWQVASFVAGVLVSLLALISPLESLADAVFAAHMLQHMLLLVVAPPLLVMGLPVKAVLRAMPRRIRRRIIRPLARSWFLHRVGRFLFHPVSVFCVFNGVLGLWHVPAIYTAARQAEPLHIVEHASFLLAGCLLWWLIVEPLRAWPKGADLTKIVFVTSCHLPMLLLGQLFLAFAGMPLYAFGAACEADWGLTPLSDQRLGGGIMFGLDMLITFATVSSLFGRYLAGLERRQRALDEVAFRDL